MSRYYRQRRRPDDTPQEKTHYYVSDNGGSGVTAKSWHAAQAMAVCAARHTGYGAASIHRGSVVDVQRYRCDSSGDGHVYTWQYSAEKFCDVPVVVAPAGMVLP